MDQAGARYGLPPHPGHPCSCSAFYLHSCSSAYLCFGSWTSSYLSDPETDFSSSSCLSILIWTFSFQTPSLHCWVSLGWLFRCLNIVPLLYRLFLIPTRLLQPLLSPSDALIFGCPIQCSCKIPFGYMDIEPVDMETWWSLGHKRQLLLESVDNDLWIDELQ